MPKLSQFLLAIGLAAPAQAEVQFRIGITPNGRALPEGEQAVVELRVVSDEPVKQPKLQIEGGDLEVVEGGVSRQFELFGNLGGGQRFDRTHRFGVKGRPGRYRIAASIETRRGETFLSDEVELVIRERTEAEKARDPELHMRLSQTTAYVGQPVDLEVLVLPKNGAGFVQEPNNFPRLTGEGFKAGNFGAPYLAEPFDGQEAVGSAARITPLKPGRIGVGAEFQPQLRSRTPTGRLRGQRYSLRAEPAYLDIKPLPTEGRPADFAGAVGDFDLSLQADPLELEIGEPIALRFSVSGKGNFDFIDVPEPTSERGWKLYKPSRMDLQPGEPGEPDRLVFAQNIVPEKNQETIPPFRLSVFDASKAEYVTLMTAPIPIKVNGVARAAAPAPTPQPVPAVTPATADPKLDDILMTGGVTAPAWAVARPPGWRRPGFWWTHLGLGAGLLTLACGTRLYLRRRAAGDTRESFHELLATLQHETLDTRQFYLVAQRCLAAWRATGGDLPPPDSEALSKIERRREYLDFSGDRDAGAVPLDDSERLATIAALRALPSPA